MGEQTENIDRVRTKIGPSVVRFMEYVGVGKEFHADDLRDWVIAETHVAPASPDRILRDLRQKGYVSYTVTNRKKSLYRVEEIGVELLKVEEKLMKLFNLTKSAKDGCEANRCKATEDLAELPGELWGRTRVKLCPRHADEAIAFAKANPDYKPDIPVAAAAEPDPSLDAELERVRKEAEVALEKLEDWEVRTQDDLVEVNEWLRITKAKRNWLEGREKRITKPIQVSLSEVRALFAPAKKHWANVEVILKAKIAQAKLREEQQNREALAAAADAHATGDTPGTQTALAHVTTVGDLKGTTTVGKWKYEVVDASQLPRAYLKVDDAALRAHCAKFTSDQQPTPIPGVKFIPDVQVRTRAAS